MQTIGRRIRMTLAFLFLAFAAAGISTACVHVNVEAAGFTGFVNQKGYYYYYKDSKKVTGFVNVNGKTYYFNPAKGGIQSMGWVKVNGKTYYFAYSTVPHIIFT